MRKGNFITLELLAYQTLSAKTSSVSSSNKSTTDRPDTRAISVIYQTFLIRQLEETFLMMRCPHAYFLLFKLGYIVCKCLAKTQYSLVVLRKSFALP